jgi:hypothetical protein
MKEKVRQHRECVYVCAAQAAFPVGFKQKILESSAEFRPRLVSSPQCSTVHS